MLNILAIYGSPRRNENSDILMNEFLSRIKTEKTNIRKIYASGADIKPCAACNGCYKEGLCIIKDDMQNIYKYFNEADIVVTTSPIYFYSVTAQLKKLIDRCQAIWASKYICKSSIISKKSRIGYFICTAGEADPGFNPACIISVIDIFYKCINVKLTEHFFVYDVDKRHVKDRPDIIDKIRFDARKIIEAFKMTDNPNRKLL